MEIITNLKYPDSLKSKAASLHEAILELSSYLEKTTVYSLTSKLLIADVIVNPEEEVCKGALSINEKMLVDISSFQNRLSAENQQKFVILCSRLGGRVNSIEGVEKMLLKIYLDAEKNSTNSNNDNQEEEGPAFLAEEPKFSFEKVIMDEATRTQIDRALTLVRNQHLIFEQWGFKEVDPCTKTILCFYGAPGTGKTMCAQAFANALGKKIMLASYATIESKWVGEGPKNLQRIFRNAAEQDAVLFFDEADSFLSKRVENAETGSDKHYNRMSNEMFQLLENYDGVVIFATNLVSDFDKAFRSRILAFVEFQRPDRDARAKLINVMIPSTLPVSPPLSEEQLLQLADIADGFSGREIRKAMLTTLSEAAMRGVQNLSIDEFKQGFSAVKNDTENLETSASKDTSVQSSIGNFITYSDENSCIVDICLNAFWQVEKPTILCKSTLARICKGINVDLPDMNTRHYLKDLAEQASQLVNSGREQECLKYCCEILAANESDDETNVSFMKTVAEALHISDIFPFQNYYFSLQGVNATLPD